MGREGTSVQRLPGRKRGRTEGTQPESAPEVRTAGALSPGGRGRGGLRANRRRIHARQTAVRLLHTETLGQRAAQAGLHVLLSAKTPTRTHGRARAALPPLIEMFHPVRLASSRPGVVRGFSLAARDAPTGCPGPEDKPGAPGCARPLSSHSEAGLRAVPRARAFAGLGGGSPAARTGVGTRPGGPAAVPAAG